VYFDRVSQETISRSELVTRELAFIHWAPLVEDYLDGIGLTLPELAAVEGGAIGGTLEALAEVGVRPTFYAFSARVSSAVTMHNEHTGIRFVVLPAPKVFRPLPRWGLASNLLAARPPLNGVRRSRAESATNSRRGSRDQPHHSRRSYAEGRRQSSCARNTRTFGSMPFRSSDRGLGCPPSRSFRVGPIDRRGPRAS
jgi:hypothetical protein